MHTLVETRIASRMRLTVQPVSTFRTPISIRNREPRSAQVEVISAVEFFLIHELKRNHRCPFCEGITVVVIARVRTRQMTPGV